MDRRVRTFWGQNAAVVDRFEEVYGRDPDTGAKRSLGDILALLEPVLLDPGNIAEAEFQRVIAALGPHLSRRGKNTLQLLRLLAKELHLQDDATLAHLEEHWPAIFASNWKRPKEDGA